jgi:hypothetical protein
MTAISSWRIDDLKRLNWSAGCCRSTEAREKHAT